MKKLVGKKKRRGGKRHSSSPCPPTHTSLVLCMISHFAAVFFFSSLDRNFSHAAAGHPAEPEHGLTTGPPNCALEQREPCIRLTMPLMVATGSAPAGSTLSPTSRSWTSGEHAQPVSTKARASVQQTSESVRPRRSTSPVSWEQSALA